MKKKCYILLNSAMEMELLFSRLYWSLASESLSVAEAVTPQR